jgi:hypothetical protein
VGTINVAEHEVHLAHNSEASDRYFNGILDEVLIYDVALSDEQIKAIHDSYFTAVEEQNVHTVSNFVLYQNYPNPFNPVTKISYSLPTSEFVNIKVYDMLGKEIRTLISEKQALGTHSVNFDATGLVSGVYFYKLQAGNKFAETKKMLLVP